MPDADNLVTIECSGAGNLIATDNGNPASSESFKSPVRKAYKGKCLAIVQTKTGSGTINIRARSEGLAPATIALKSR